MSVTLADIQAAAGRIKGHAVETPLLESPALNDRLGARILMKPETLQRVGAFKFRGAYNRLVQLDADQRTRGVVAFSSGNHAQGVALAAQLLGMPAVIVMPADAPAIKVANTRAYGAEVVHYDRMTEDRIAIAGAIARDRGAVVVPAYDDAHIIAGQGTVGLELIQQAKALGTELDMAITPIGGGGLMAGTATAIKSLSPRTLMVGAEPAGYDDALQSLQRGERVTIKPATRSLCDALETPSTGILTFPALQATVSAIAVVSDTEVAEAMRYGFNILKLVVEPGGIVGLAALLAGKVEAIEGRTIGLVLSGGNVDPDLFSRVLQGEF